MTADVAIVKMCTHLPTCMYTDEICKLKLQMFTLSCEHGWICLLSHVSVAEKSLLHLEYSKIQRNYKLQVRKPLNCICE